MHSHDSRPRRPTLAQLLTALSAALVLIYGFTASTAQSPQDKDEKEEREFKNGLPAHVPLKVKVKNEQAFKNVKNKEWAKELEIEVKNTGTKPIYYLHLAFTLDDFRLDDGHAVGFSIAYGRSELMYLDTPLTPEDVPIKPGETVTLKIPEEQARGYGLIRDRRQKSDARKIKFDMQFINFGDGTGLETPVGVPSYNRRGSQTPPASEQSERACGPPQRKRAPEIGAEFLTTSYRSKPATFLRVKFLSPEESPTEPAPARACDCQNIPNCFYGKLQCANHGSCTNNCQFLAHVSTGNCSDTAARCRQVQMVHQPCPTQSNGTQTCSFDQPLAPCAVSDPTPTPTPEPSPDSSPSPTPAPTCDPAARPNPTNCVCNTVLIPGRAVWDCHCPGGAEPADGQRRGPAAGLLTRAPGGRIG